MKLTIQDLEINDRVNVYPNDNDVFLEFEGRITGFEKNLIQVVDGDGDTFDVTINQIELVNGQYA